MQLFIILFGITVRCWPVFLGIAHHSDHSSDRLDSKGWQPWSKGWVVCVGGLFCSRECTFAPWLHTLTLLKANFSGPNQCPLNVGAVQNVLATFDPNQLCHSGLIRAEAVLLWLVQK